MNEQQVETLIVGAGQAGLSTAYHLTRRGRDCLVIDSSARVGDNWRQQWDTLRLFTPAKYDGLPGMDFPADPWHFPGKEEVAEFLERYAAHFELPVRTNTRVDRLRADPSGGFRASIGPDTITCANVVVATGTFGRAPSIPAFADELSEDILQLHSSAYRRPSQLQDGPALVVGASHSGADIAFELAADRLTILCGPDRGQLPIRIESRPAHAILPLVVFAWRHILTRRTPMGRTEMGEVRAHGGPLVRVKRSDLAERGVERIEQRVVGVSAGRPRLEDGRTVDVANVIWCTGFRQDFGWIEPQLQTGEDGWPVEQRGVVDGAPGLFFCGLSFQYAFSSMVLAGVGRDADYVAQQIVARAEEGASTLQAA